MTSKLNGTTTASETETFKYRTLWHTYSQFWSWIITQVTVAMSNPGAVKRKTEPKWIRKHAKYWRDAGGGSRESRSCDDRWCIPSPQPPDKVGMRHTFYLNRGRLDKSVFFGRIPKACLGPTTHFLSRNVVFVHVVPFLCLSVIVCVSLAVLFRTLFELDPQHGL